MKQILIIFSLLTFCILFSYNSKNTNAKQENKDIESDSLQNQTEIDNITFNLEGWEFDTLKVEKRVHINDDINKEGMYVNITFVYPKTSPQGIDVNKIQNSVSRLFLLEKKTSLSPSQALAKVNREYTLDAKEEAKEWQEGAISFSNFERSKYFSIESVSPHFMTTLANYYSYLGGAHGSSYVSFNNIDLKDGRILSDSIIYKEGYKTKLSKLIQNEVIRRNESTDRDDHIMLLVDVNEITPNNNFYFTPKGIVYVYNQYEVSPYVQGVVEIIISTEKIKVLLKTEYQYIVNDIKNNNIKELGKYNEEEE